MIPPSVVLTVGEEARRVRPSPPPPLRRRTGLPAGVWPGRGGRFGEMALYRSPWAGRNGHDIISSINEDNSNNEAGEELVSMERRAGLQIMGSIHSPVSAVRTALGKVRAGVRGPWRDPSSDGAVGARVWDDRWAWATPRSCRAPRSLSAVGLLCLCSLPASTWGTCWFSSLPTCPPLPIPPGPEPEPSSAEAPSGALCLLPGQPQLSPCCLLQAENLISQSAGTGHSSSQCCFHREAKRLRLQRDIPLPRLGFLSFGT